MRTASARSPRTRSSSRATNTTNAELFSQLASWLNCPACGAELGHLDALVLGCVHGHRFDANRRGYLSVLDRASGIAGDPKPVLDRRERFLAGGHYSAIAAGVITSLDEARLPEPELAILDSGCGTGYYLQAVLAQDAALYSGLAVDVSAAAVQRSVAFTGAPGLVADVWRPSPVRDNRADVIMCVFAPRNSAEFHRVLRPDGALIIVTPAPDHLEQLRAAGLAIGIQENKSNRLDEALAAEFVLQNRTSVRYTIELDSDSVTDLAGMGPSGHHETNGEWHGDATTVSVEVSRYRPRLP